MTTPRRVLLLRHGRTRWNAEHRFQGQADPPLDDVGRAQAYEVAGLVAAFQSWSAGVLRRYSGLADCGADRRSHRAADQDGPPLAGKITRSLGGPDPGRGRRAFSGRRYADWVAGRDVSRRGGETRAEVAERACDALDDLPMVDCDCDRYAQCNGNGIVRGVAGFATGAACCSVRSPTAIGRNCGAIAVGNCVPITPEPPATVIRWLAPDEDVPDAEA